MLPVLDNARMREADRHTIETLGMPGLVLMENAATGLVEAIRDRFGAARRVLIVAGRGNNGGDGLAAARHLACGGLDVRVVLLADPARLSPDAATNLELARAFGVPVEAAPAGELTPLERALARGPDLVVDALLGTGLDRPLGGRLLEAVRRIGACGAPVVAVDVPTGLSGSSSQPPGEHLEADLTVTFAALKVCHVLPPACLACGEVAVAEIGIPPAALEADPWGWWVEAGDAALWLPPRPAHGHKGTFGHLLVLAGSRGKGGAAAMAARAAVAAGSGLVTMAVPAPVVPVVDGACLEAMSFSLPATPDGLVAGPGDLEALLPRITAVAAGPGLGTGPGARQTLEWLLDTWKGPLLLDADALNLLAGNPERLAGREVPPVLTPHPGELARLLGRQTAEVVADRPAAAREAARRAQAVVVAKGFRTVLATPDGRLLVNPTGDARLASGGSGDVLTGLAGGLLAQSLEPERAAALAAWLHGRAGELAGERWPAAVPAARLPEFVAAAWQELEEAP